MKEFSFEIRDKDGIHARPAGLLVKEANKFSSDITIQKGEKSADAKKIFGIMGLAAKCGDTITLKAEGADEEAAAAGLEAFMNENW